MHFRKAVQKQIWVQPTAIEDIDRLFYLFACLCNHSDCHVFGRRRCTSIGYVSIPNQQPLVGHSGHCHLAGSWKRQTNAGAPVLLWKGSLHLSGKLIILLESNRIVTSFTLQESATKCVLQGSWLWAIHWFPQQHTDIYLAQTRVSSALTSSLAWIFGWFCWRFLSVLEKNDGMLWATGTWPLSTKMY